MKRLLCFVIIAFSFVSLSLAWAADGVQTEITTDALGNTLVRSVTPGDPGVEFAPPLGPVADQSTLWETDDPTAIAQNVDISGNGQTIVVGWWLNNMRTSRYATIGTGAPVWEYTEPVNFFLPVSSSDNGNVVASAGSQVPLNVWLNGVGPNPSWSYTSPAGFDWVDIDVSDNGAYVVAVCKETGSGSNAKLFVFNSSISTVLWQADYTATNGVNGVEISENNGWVVVSCYSNFFVYQMSTQSLFYMGPNYSQTICGIDDDAEYLAEGDFYGVLHLYRRVGTTYVQQWQNTMGGWVTAVDISSDASTVLAGNYTYSPSNAGLVRGFGIDGTVRFTYSQYGDYVASVALCNDGSKGVAGSWGQYGATYGDVFTAFNMSTGAVIYHLLDDINEPGSIFSVAISDNGAYATAGGKAVHAREFGNGGQTYSFELGAPLNVDITVTPVNPPITIPQGGGSFSFNLSVRNLGPTQQPFWVWGMIQFPNGTIHGPVLGPVQINPPVNVTITRMRNQTVPGSWPGGTFLWIGYAAHSYPPTVVADSSYFPFTKSADAGNGPLVWEATCSGEPFPGETMASAPTSFSMLSASPNPFNPTTAISFKLQAASHVSLRVYDTTGRLVATLVNGMRQAGSHQITFDGSNLASGVYLYRLEAGTQTALGKMVLLK